MPVLTIGYAIKGRRKELRIKQPDLAEMAGISVNTLYRIERNKANPTLNILKRIASTLGMELRMQVKAANK